MADITDAGENMPQLAYQYLNEQEISDDVQTLALLNAFEEMLLNEQAHGVVLVEEIN